jgi:hypothetical protein
MNISDRVRRGCLELEIPETKNLREKRMLAVMKSRRNRTQDREREMDMEI